MSKTALLYYPYFTQVERHHSNPVQKRLPKIICSRVFLLSQLKNAMKLICQITNMAQYSLSVLAIRLYQLGQLHFARYKHDWWSRYRYLRY